jgi:preprotein translocase subunit YajC
MSSPFQQTPAQPTAAATPFPGPDIGQVFGMLSTLLGAVPPGAVNTASNFVSQIPPAAFAGLVQSLIQQPQQQPTSYTINEMVNDVMKNHGVYTETPCEGTCQNVQSVTTEKVEDESNVTADTTPRARTKLQGTTPSPSLPTKSVKLTVKTEKSTEVMLDILRIEKLVIDSLVPQPDGVHTSIVVTIPGSALNQLFNAILDLSDIEIVEVR